jgi:hypothetical protein
MIDSFALAQLLTATATIERPPEAVGGKRGAAVEVGAVAQLLIVPAAQFGRVFGATAPLAGGKASYIALILASSVTMDTPGDTLISASQSYAVIGKPALWHTTLLAVDLNAAVA